MKFEVHCSALQFITVHYSVFYCIPVHCSAFQCSALHCSVLKWISVHCNTLQCYVMHYSILQCITLNLSSFECTAVRCSALQCNAVYYSTVLPAGGWVGILYDWCLWTIQCTVYSTVYSVQCALCSVQPRGLSSLNRRGRELQFSRWCKVKCRIIFHVV